MNLKVVNDWNNLPNGAFCSIRYRKFDGRKACGYNKETKSGGAYIIATYSGIQKADYDAYKKVQDSIAVLGELSNATRINEVPVDNIKCLFYNTKQGTTKILVPGANIKCTKKEYYIPTPEGDKEVSQEEYNKYLESCGLTTGAPSKAPAKRGIDCRQFNISNILGLNNIVYAQ